ncbi:outer membrane lipoprotein carrier protein LolA [Mariniphaga sediminis]|uniref:Outer membrane lipoprotein carrier protein LolA n=1 Tax=Mariniphaga sediminis TaxID=1628158 RepID=A0A399D9S8_9BACT|nr:outer membrane lipoprotein carrier protein LolA [Mariniphaga sediminis]RIH67051.1 outer membrane lipoprotein carrier protein LolA [Mariniphaga sediminis]
MKSIFLLGLLLASVFFAIAQQDPKAKQILDEMSEKTRSYESIAADFVFSLENKEMDISEKNEGSIKLKDQKYVVDLPALGVKVFSDGETLWNYMKDGNQVTISNIEDGGNELMDPSSIFTIYEKGFQSKFMGEKVSGNSTAYQIELYPDSGEYDVSKILLSIGKSDKMIKSALLYGTDGNVYGIIVKKMDTDTNLPDSFFVFNTNDYGDLEVIDFR